MLDWIYGTGGLFRAQERATEINEENEYSFGDSNFVLAWAYNTSDSGSMKFTTGSLDDILKHTWKCMKLSNNNFCGFKYFTVTFYLID